MQSEWRQAGLVASNLHTCLHPAHTLPPTPFPSLRIVGYCAHWRESLADPDTKIIRPQQDYRGVWLRQYEGVEGRSAEGGLVGEGEAGG